MPCMPAARHGGCNCAHPVPGGAPPGEGTRAIRRRRGDVVGPTPDGPEAADPREPEGNTMFRSWMLTALASWALVLGTSASADACWRSGDADYYYGGYWRR